MIKKYTIGLLLIFSLGVNSQRKQMNHIILIDTSGSMRGRPVNSGNMNIWEPTKRNITKYIGKISVGNTITIYSFDSHLSKKSTFDIRSKNDRNKAKKYVNSLKASGGNTCLYSSLYRALDNLEKESAIYEKQLFYVFTDLAQACEDEVFTVQDVKRKFTLAKSKDLEHLYYISLGKEVPKGIEEWSKIDTSVTSTSKNPIVEDIFPKININSNAIDIDFSKKRIVDITVPITYTKQFYNSSIKVSLSCQNEKIQLLTKNAILAENHIVLKFKIDDSCYSFHKEKGELSFFSSEIKELKDKVSVNFILPKRREIKIEIK